MSLFKRSKKPAESAFDRMTVPGVPSVFTGGDTTIGEVRRMTVDIRDVNAQTHTERGLAITLLAVLDLFEQTLSDEGEG